MRPDWANEEEGEAASPTHIVRRIATCRSSIPTRMTFYDDDDDEEEMTEEELWKPRVDSEPRTVLITGACGNIGRKLRAAWEDVYDLILIDAAADEDDLMSSRPT